MDRCCGDNAAVLVTAVWPLVFAGKHCKGMIVHFDDAVESGEVGLIDLFIRIDLEDLKVVILIRDKDTVTDLNLLQERERTGVGGVEMVMSGNNGRTFTRHRIAFQQTGVISQPGDWVGTVI